MKRLSSAVGIVSLLLTGALASPANAAPAQGPGPNSLQGIATNKPALELPQTHPHPIVAPAIHHSQIQDGKGAYLFYSFVPSSPIYWANFSPTQVIQQARDAHLRFLQLRVGYSNWFQVSPGPQQEWLNELLDLARTNGIHIVAWVVPYANTQSAATIQTSLNGDWQVVEQAITYRTPTGARFDGLSMDLELGPLYFNHDPNALATYVSGVRKIAGPAYPLIGIVPDPARTGLNSNPASTLYYPYVQVGRASNVLEPMAYWHEYYASDHFNYSNTYVSQFIDAAITSTRQQANAPRMPINVTVQAYGNALVGYPSSQELQTAISTANSAGAVGITAFQWDTLTTSYWQVLGGYIWRRG